MVVQRRVIVPGRVISRRALCEKNQSGCLSCVRRSRVMLAALCLQRNKAVEPEGRGGSKDVDRRDGDELYGKS